METLEKQKCIACSKQSKKLNEDEIKKSLSELIDWHLVDEDNQLQLHKKFMFKNYDEALIFVNNVSLIAQKENHHPKIVLEWGCVNVFYFTHAIKALHLNDFICAFKIDEIKRSF